MESSTSEGKLAQNSNADFSLVGSPDKITDDCIAAADLEGGNQSLARKPRHHVRTLREAEIPGSLEG